MGEGRGARDAEEVGGAREQRPGGGGGEGLHRRRGIAAAAAARPIEARGAGGQIGRAHV